MLPAALPTLLFCRRAELTAAMQTAQEQDVWAAMVKENLLLEWTANDIKIIGNDLI
jgi:hypothetical protein